MLAIGHHWHVVFARSLSVAVEYRKRLHVSVALYDCDLPGVDWRRGFQTILDCGEPVCAILLSHNVTTQLRRLVMESGGYDIAPKGDGESLGRLIDGALLLAKDADEAANAFMANDGLPV